MNTPYPRGGSPPPPAVALALPGGQATAPACACALPGMDACIHAGLPPPGGLAQNTALTTYCLKLSQALRLALPATLSPPCVSPVRWTSRPHPWGPLTRHLPPLPPRSPGHRRALTIFERAGLDSHRIRGRRPDLRKGLGSAQSRPILSSTRACQGRTLTDLKAQTGQLLAVG